jgi:flagellar basal-body rod protein FlgG
MRALNTAATGMQAQQLNVEVIANNIANMNTTGFKRQRAEFEDLLYQSVEKMGVSSSDANTIVPTGVQVGSGVKSGSVYRITEQGNMSQSGNPYDIAIQGDGYFVVQLPDGRDAYTRAGNFSLNADGQIVTGEGYVVSPGISVPSDASSVSINRQGVVSAIMADGSTPQDVGALELARFVNPPGLDAIGENMFLETAASGAANRGQPGSIGFGTLQQGYLETSNVNAVSEISDLITAQRAYEMNSKVITTTDQMLQTMTQLR